jgi:hypothetical protein
VPADKLESAMTPREAFVRDLVEKEPELAKDEIDVFLAWLKASGPDEWHRWATSWNWDHGTELFEWIVNQPNCDRGAALSLYYGCRPDFFTRFASVEEARAEKIFDEAIDLIALICQTWRLGGYPNYAYRPHDVAITEYLANGIEAMQELAANVPWDVPDDLPTAGIHGEPNNFDDTVDGIPTDVLLALGEDY